LNRLLGKQQGFAVGPTVNPCTKGIYVWGKPLVINRPDEEPLNVLLVDTEGIGSIQQDQTYDVKIFSLAILLSSYFVYNSMAIIDERALDGLSLVVNLTKQITARSNTSSGKANGKAKGTKQGEHSASELADYFPHFLWLLRDFALDLVDEKGIPITSKQYLENSLKERPEQAQQSKNAIRSTIKQLFRERDCVTLVRPVMDERQLKTIDAIPYNQLRPEFRQQSDDLVTKILEEAPPKQINGQNLTGESFSQLLSIYTESINSGAVASIQSAWESLSAQVNQQAMEEAFHAWTSGINAKYNPNRPLNDDHLQTLHIECMNEAFGIYDAMCYHGTQAVTMRKQLKAKLVTEFARLVQSNREASSRFVLRILTNLYEPLEANAKNGQFKSIDALLEAWTALRKNFFDQLGDSQASRVVAYDEFLKFFSTNLVTTSSNVMKTIKDAHTSQVEQIKKKLEELTSEKHALELASVKAIEESKRLTTLLNVAEKNVKSLETEVAKLKADLKESHNQVVSLQSQLTKANTEASKASSETVKANAELKLTQNNLQALETKLNATIASLTTGLKDKTKIHEGSLKELDAAKKQIVTLEATLTTTKQSLEKSEKLAVETSKLAEQSAHTDKQKLQATLDKTMREKVALEASKAKLEKEKIAAEKHADNLDNLIIDMKKRYSDLEQESSEQTSQMEKVVAELKKEKEKSQANEKRAQSQSNLEQQAALTRLQNALNTMTKERDDEKRAHAAATKQIDRLHEKHVEEIGPLTVELEEKTLEVARLKRELAEAKKVAPGPSSVSSSSTALHGQKLPIYAVEDDQSNDIEEETPEVKRKTGAAKRTKSVSKRSSVAVEPAVASSSNEVDIPAPSAKKSATSRGKKSAAAASSSNAMDVDDIELPIPPSRKRGRPSDFSETAEVSEMDVETPTKAKRAQNDPTKMDKPTLKSTLTSFGIKLPPGDHPKQIYVDLFNKKFGGNKK
jgi:hypothetical protein